MNKEDKLQLAHWAIDTAKKYGAQESSVVISEGRSSDILVREQRIDQLQESISLNLGIDIYVNNRFSSHSTNRLNKKELDQFIKSAIESTRFLSKDPFRQLPDPKLYFSGSSFDLKNCDTQFEKVSAEDKIKLTHAVEDEIYLSDSRILSIETSFNDSWGESVMINSNGFEGARKVSNFTISASVSIMGNGDARPSDYDYKNSVFFSHLTKTGIGTSALSRALKKIGQQKVKSGIFPMMVDNRVASKLLSPIISSLNGSSIQQKNSFLIDQLEKQVTSSLVNLVDDPFVTSSTTSRFYDYEGLATKKRDIFIEGKLDTYFIDTYYAKKLVVNPTSGQTTNLILHPGQETPENLISNHHKIFLITGFNGGNCNSSTGDFSYGIEGFLYENGQLICPISEMNITGNMIQLWQSLIAIGNDPNPNSSWKIPSLLFDNIHFSGK